MIHRNATPPRAGTRRCAARAAITAALVVGFVLPSARARAQSVDLCVHEMSDDDIEAHTSRIVGELRAHRRHARAWRFGWLAAYTGIAVVALGVLMPGIERNADDPDDRARRLGYIGAGTAASVAAARLAFYPMPDVWGARRIENMPTGTRQERIAQARYAEDVISRAGAWQRLMTGSTSYAIAIGWGLAWGTALSVKYDSPFTSALAFVGSPVLGIATVLTAPSWAQLYSDNLRGGVCGHVYVEERESALGEDEDALHEGQGEDQGEDEDDWTPPADLESARGPSVTVYPTFGGAGMMVTF